MEVELGFQPNCSEVVYRVPGVEKEDFLVELEKIGIRQIMVKDFWVFSTPEPMEMLSDEDNPNMPDYTRHSHMWVTNETDHFDGCEVRAHQHCQHQLFATMLKISSQFGGEWGGYDGGTIDAYDEWLETEEKIDNYQLEISMPCGDAPKKDLDKIVEHARITYGINLKLKLGGHQNKVWMMELPKYDADMVDPCAVHPKHFCGVGRSVEDLVQAIRVDLRHRVQAVMPKKDENDD
jgi:hypothetical protein